MANGSRPLWKSEERRVLPKDVEPEYQLKEDHRQMADWVNMLAPWEVFATGTFRYEAGMWSANKAWKKVLNGQLARCSCFYALERNPSRDGYHIHALLGDCTAIFFKDVWAQWFQRYGRFHSEPVRHYGDVSRYCSKYVCKRSAWWDVRLQWHRFQALHKRDFKLREDSWPAADVVAPPQGEGVGRSSQLSPLRPEL